MQSQQTLELRQRQQLALTPELQQSIRFLQLSALELNQELAQAILENPLLESETEYDTDGDLAVEADIPSLTVDWSTSVRRRHRVEGDDDDDNWQATAPETLQDYLLRQLNMARAGSRDDALVRALVHELDQDGYLVTPVDDIVAYLQQYVPVEHADVLAALQLLQTFDPAGVGARDLGECLSLQLVRLQSGPRARSSVGADVQACARSIVNHHLDVLATGNLIRLQQTLGCDSALLKAAHGLILSLEPRPGREWATDVADYVIPDVFVRKAGSQWQAVLNPANVPRVRVHSLYSAMLEQSEQNVALREKLYQAQGVVRSVHHRFDTILRVSQAIVEHQQDYFEHGVRAMRPLVLRDIAQRLDIHESTVSRATRFKYAQTPHGVIELRRFFGSTVDTDDGESTSARAVHFMIAQLIETEPRQKPLSDSKIATLLEKQGVRIARRTVAKYREDAGIEPAIRRKARYSLLESDD